MFIEKLFGNSENISFGYIMIRRKNKKIKLKFNFPVIRKIRRIVTFHIYGKKNKNLSDILQIFAKRIDNGVMYMPYDEVPLGLKIGSYFCLYKKEMGNDGNPFV